VGRGAWLFIELATISIVGLGLRHRENEMKRERGGEGWGVGDPPRPF